MKKIKLAVFDLEGTIFRNSYRGKDFPSLWAVICNLCGPDAAKEDDGNREKFYAGKYAGYSEWVIDTLKIHQKYGLKRNQLESLINSIDYYPGVAETFEALRLQGINIAIISGGLKALADRAAIDYKIEHCFASAEYFWNQDGTVRHWNVMPTDFAHKKSVLEILSRDLGISADECLFVGDGRNDRAVAGHCALSIGFNPHDELRPDVDVIIEQPKGAENLAAVLQPIARYPHYTLNDFCGYKIWNIRREDAPFDTIIAGTLSQSGQRDAYHAFLVRNGLTSNSADSYCSYMNNLCRNIAAISWNEASHSTAFSVLVKNAATCRTEEEFINALQTPLAGEYGRENDCTSAAKQFWRYAQ
ncbi:HAD family hydrolase [Pelotalea chapellei]|uniref:phosphoserine phosphatase n=1 Tax=Pelotalea chapellei TaxID=44671 RepID=A0ABS5U4W7_9BACT|nr:HAD family hydrolase [Pelotalea chapellei]MBT1070694.1 HAD family hydrolase [Pelotalea chapellei]